MPVVLQMLWFVYSTLSSRHGATSMTHPTLFDPPVRHDHPPTSHQAAERIAPKAGTLRAKVYEKLKQWKAHGLTDENMQLFLNMNPSTQRPRRIELVTQGLVKNSGRVRQTRSGRNAIVWVVV